MEFLYLAQCLQDIRSSLVFMTSVGTLISYYVGQAEVLKTACYKDDSKHLSLVLLSSYNFGIFIAMIFAIN